MKRFIYLVIILMISFSVYAETLIVDQFNGPYYTIGSAYNAAQNGDTILIYPGTYLESVNISKEITLEGIDPNSTIIQTNLGYVLRINTGNVNISNLKIICTHEGIEIYASTPEITHCIFEDCSVGIFIDGDDLYVKNCIFQNCNKGISFDWATNYVPFGGTVINNIFHDCSIGIFMHTTLTNGTNCDANIYSNIIVNCSTYGIREEGNGSYSGMLDYNCFHSNAINNSSVNLGEHNIYPDQSDSVFYDIGSSNYYLQQNSPCIDAGITGVAYEDLDGTRNDMGIFGGPHQWGGGKPTVINMQIDPESVTPGQTINIEATGQIK
ncbi:MAG: hypothetical protein P9X26_04330 [Candidatus Stygibacter frigidus]|nr:hypothetical protein [Candidatus Stygibacter frigidus]